MSAKDKALLVLAGVGIGELVMAAILYQTQVTIEQERPTPRLVGHECLGSGGDLWAMEESDFPTQCDSIERYRG